MFRKKGSKGFVLAVTSIIVITASIIAIIQIGMCDSNDQVASTNSDSTSNLAIDQQQDKNESSQAINNSLIFVETEAPVDNKLYFDPDKTKFENWTREDFIAYLEADPRPSFMLDTLKEVTKNSLEIVKDNSGNVIHDNFTFYYTNEIKGENKKEIIIEVSKGKVPNRDYDYLDKHQSLSRLNGHVVALGYYAVEDLPKTLFAETIFNNIGYYIRAENIEEEDLILVLESILGN